MTRQQVQECREWSRRTKSQRKASPGVACSWCHHTMIKGRPVAQISVADWPKYADHGICIVCSTNAVSEAKKRHAACQKETV